MSPLLIIICALLGPFAASVIWTLSRNQTTRRPLLTAPRCEDDLGISFTRNTNKTATPSPESADDQTPDRAACGQSLPPLAWLPFFSFGTARRCPNCQTQQSPWRLYFELATALYFALAAVRIDDGLTLVSVLVFSLPLLMILLVDTWTRLIYTNVIYMGIVAGLIFAFLDDGLSCLGSAALAMLAALGIFAVFFALARVLYRSVAVVPFGRGDIFLAVMIASMVGLSDILRALFLGIVFAAIGGVLLIVTKQVTRRQAMPYGPFLCLGALIAFIW